MSHEAVLSFDRHFRKFCANLHANLWHLRAQAPDSLVKMWYFPFSIVSFWWVLQYLMLVLICISLPLMALAVFHVFVGHLDFLSSEMSI